MIFVVFIQFKELREYIENEKGGDQGKMGTGGSRETRQGFMRVSLKDESMPQERDSRPLPAADAQEVSPDSLLPNPPAQHAFCAFTLLCISSEFLQFLDVSLLH